MYVEKTDLIKHSSGSDNGREKKIHIFFSNSIQNYKPSISSIRISLNRNMFDSIISEKKMIYFLLIFIDVFSLINSIESSPFQLTIDYDDKQIINSNFTIKIELQRRVLLPIDCENNRDRLCLVELTLQIQSESMSVDIWCQSPAFSFANFHSNQPKHTCLIPAIDSMQQPSIIMIVNAHDLGTIRILATANFTYAPQYNLEKRAEQSIEIVVRMNIRVEAFVFFLCV